MGVLAVCPKVAAQVPVGAAESEVCFAQLPVCGRASSRLQLRNRILQQRAPFLLACRSKIRFRS